MRYEYPTVGWLSCSFACHVARGVPVVTGADIANITGTPVNSVADGRVSIATAFGGTAGIYGEVDSGDFLIRYLHLSRLDVQAGDQVTSGQRIGLMGSTGNSTGPHLHFDWRYREKKDALWVMEPVWDANPEGWAVDPMLAIQKSQQITRKDDDDMRLVQTPTKIYIVDASGKRHINDAEVKAYQKVTNPEPAKMTDAQADAIRNQLEGAGASCNVPALPWKVSK